MTGKHAGRLSERFQTRNLGMKSSKSLGDKSEEYENFQNKPQKSVQEALL